MESKPVIRTILWTLWLLSTCCKCGSLNTTEDNSTIVTTITSTSINNIATPNKSNTPLVQCKCDPGEVMDHTGQCQHWADGTTVPVGSEHKGNQSVSTTEFNVTVAEPQCQYRQIDLQEGQFILRNRGDLLVTEGPYLGLRVSEYCIHHQQIEGKIEVTAKGCVSVPVIPRCCADGEYLKDGVCVSTTMDVISFNPPLATGPFGKQGLAGATFPFDDRLERVGIPNCSTTGYVMKKVELDWQNAYLAAVMPETVVLTLPPDNDKRRYISPVQYCVDGLEKDDIYIAHYCQKDVGVYCTNKACINKCCPDDQILSLEARGCVPGDIFSKPPLPRSNSLTILNGFYPNCGPKTDIVNYTLLPDGSLSTEDETYSFNEFCIDNFWKENSVQPGALICVKGIQETTWHNVRRKLFPVCIGLSCVFLVLLLLLNAWIPKLKEKEESNLLYHAASLLLAFSVSLVVRILVPMGYILDGNCMALAFVMQFAFLSAFFWLNTMCLDMWRLSRNLIRNNYGPIPSLAAWKYLLYAFGGPFIITVITIIVQFAAPKDGSIPGLVHPRIGEGRCWFRSGQELLVYFYGPIAVLFLLNFIFIGTTYYYLRIIRGDYKSTDNPRKLDFFAAYWQRFYLLVLISGCWVTEILSSYIPPEELWAITDILNNLQGVFVFIVFVSPHNKRVLLKEKLQNLFKFNSTCINQTEEEQSANNNSTQNLSKAISSQKDNFYVIDKTL